MNLNTKFDIGQTVYSLKDKMGAVIVDINAYITKSADAAKSETEIRYLCNLEDGGSAYVYEESELTAEKPKPTIYDLKPGDEYFLICDDGQVSQTVYSDTKDTDYFKCYKERAIACGNASLTREEAEKEVNRRKIHQELKRLSNGYEFTAGKPNYYIFYYYPNEYVETTTSGYSYCPGIVYFPTYEAVENAISIVGEERLIDDYFGVEEA